MSLNSLCSSHTETQTHVEVLALQGHYLQEMQTWNGLSVMELEKEAGVNSSAPRTSLYLHVPTVTERRASSLCVSS